MFKTRLEDCRGRVVTVTGEPGLGRSGMNERAPEREGSAKQARETEALLAALVESCDDAILTKSPDGVITSWNRGAERIFGYAPGEVVGGSMAVIVAGRTLEEREILATAMSGKAINGLETEGVRKDGSVVVISVTVSPVRDAADRVVSVSVIARDITARREYTRRRRRVRSSLT
jgi:PAS domain S-box-containing protein